MCSTSPKMERMSVLKAFGGRLAITTIDIYGRRRVRLNDLSCSCEDGCSNMSKSESRFGKKDGEIEVIVHGCEYK